MEDQRYALFEIWFTDKTGNSIMKNILFPDNSWQFELNKYAKDEELIIRRTVCLASNIEVSPYHNFHDA